MGIRETKDLEAIGAKYATTTPEPEFVPLEAFEPIIPDNARALRYWKSLPRAEGKVPLKSDCDLLEIVDLLPRCLVLNLDGPTQWPIKMVGTEIVTHFGLDATGMNAYDLYPPEERVSIEKRMRTMSTRRAVMCTISRFKNTAGVTMDTEWVFMPFCDKTGDVVRTVCSISPFERSTKLQDFEIGGNLNNRRLLRIIFASG